MWEFKEGVHLIRPSDRQPDRETKRQHAPVQGMRYLCV